MGAKIMVFLIPTKCLIKNIFYLREILLKSLIISNEKVAEILVNIYPFYPVLYFPIF